MRSVRVLVADDIGTVRAVVRNLLISLDVNRLGIFEASDGAAALKLLADERPDLIITDWNMPGASGLDVLSAARELDKKVRVLMLTSNNERDQVIDAIRQGADDYVLKPFTRTQLLDKLAFWLNKVETSAASDAVGSETRPAPDGGQDQHEDDEDSELDQSAEE